MESIEITDRGASQIARGLLWIYSNEIFKKPPKLTPGAWSTFHCRSKIVATGYANPHSLIFGRVLALGDEPDIEALLKRRLDEAFARRPKITATQAARLVYSEADFLPGLVIDVYADAIVLQSNTAGIDAALPLLEMRVPAAFETYAGRKPRALVVKADAGVRRLEQIDDFSKVVFGDAEALKNWAFEEQNTQFSANLIEGQKTGFFLDQKDNRAFMTSLIKPGNARVLDLCSYSGGWGLRALMSGAGQATFVDESAAALQLVERGVDLNKIAKNRVRLARSDVFKFLADDAGQYDIIVADPPAFVKTKKHLPQAEKAYEKLNRLAWARLKTDGILVTCSCSYHLTETDFVEILKTAVAKAKGLAHLIHRGEQAADHPTLLSMPETRYLKCVFLKKLA